jgi:hypothetical protein
MFGFLRRGAPSESSRVIQGEPLTEPRSPVRARTDRLDHADDAHGVFPNTAP